MGQVQSILGATNLRKTYSPIPTHDTFENERDIVNPSPPQQHQQQQQRRFHHLPEDNVSQHYLLCWLDEHSNDLSLDTECTKVMLSKFYRECWKFYTQANEFLTDIQGRTHEIDKILLVVSGALAEEVLPQVKNIVPVVIIFCSNYSKYITLKSKTYRNVVDVCTDHDTLKYFIQRELPSLKLCLNDNTPLKSMRCLVSTTSSDSKIILMNNNRTSSEITIGNETCFSYIIIIDLLKKMPQTDEGKNIWLNKCREYYRGNEGELKNIAKFSEVYQACDAIHWYTKQSFVFKLVNQALRTEDITLWYLFRYYLVDLCKQLEIVHQDQNYPTNLTLYRGQSMSREEFESISIDGLFLTTAFFSTSTNISIAKGFIGGTQYYSNERIPVLFEIAVESVNVKTVVFVDIDQHLADKYNECASENEILFAVGSIFRVTAVGADIEDSRLQKIYMKATDDGADIVQHQLDLIKKKYPNIGVNLLFGRYLLDMNHLSKAKSYFQMLLYELKSLNNEQHYYADLAFINNSLGELCIRTTNYKEAYEYFKEDYTIRSRNKFSTDLFISNISFGNYYKAIGNSLQAEEEYMKALSIMKKNTERNKINIRRLNIYIASIYAIRREFYKSLTLCFETVNLLTKTSSTYPSYFEMIICQGLIGDIYFMQQIYKKAEHYYLNAFNLCNQYLYIGHRQLIHCICSLTELYYKQFNDNGHYAFNFCKNQLELHQTHLSKNHLSIAYLLIKLGQISQDISCYQRAIDILTHIDYLEYLTIAQCYQYIADYYAKNGVDQNIDRAEESYSKAKEIYKKIYPEDHDLIHRMQDLIDSIRN
ncbi:unnamed protein product [Adineta ricciae]|uniref:Uncharacterized protein n=1 Tax=Adineta ricciae TaxID=249248 RepID=A0A815QEG8_ADIRI|nr:unnamed protein product [Adineta ricciae]CAF1462905.1 unnamed protein product [Adineta ricciae]